MSYSLDALSDTLGYLLVVTVLFAFPIGLAIYSAYEVIEQIARSDEQRKPVPGMRFRQPRVELRPVRPPSPRGPETLAGPASGETTHRAA